MLSAAAATSTRWSLRRLFQVSKARQLTGWSNVLVHQATRDVTVSTVSQASTGSQVTVVPMVDAFPALAMGTQIHVTRKQGSASVATTRLVSIASSALLDITETPPQGARTPAPLVRVLRWEVGQVLATQ